MLTFIENIVLGIKQWVTEIVDEKSQVIASNINNLSENKADKSEIPDSTSDLTNDSGFITEDDISGKEDTDNKVTEITSSSTNEEYPSAKAVYDIVQTVSPDIAPLTVQEIRQLMTLLVESPIYIAALYIDDFPDDSVVQDWGYRYIADFAQNGSNDFANLRSFGVNYFVPTQETIEFDDEVYYVWIGLTRGNSASLYGLTTQEFTYEQLQEMSMNANSDNRICPFDMVLTEDSDPNNADETYAENLGERFSLVSVCVLDRLITPMDESHSSEFDTLYVDNFYDFGLHSALLDAGCSTIQEYIDYITDDNESHSTYRDHNDTITYDGVEYRIFECDGEDWGGLVPVNLTYQDLYPTSIEADSDNIKEAHCPFAALFDFDNDSIRYTDINRLETRKSNLIAIR